MKLNLPAVQVRPFAKEDLPSLLDMMKALAKFEGYIDDFRVTEDEIIANRWVDDPEFLGLVAQNTQTDELIGMAIAYLVRFSYDLRPVAILKELYVETICRDSGTGKALFNGIADWARSNGCSKMRWDVLRENVDAKRFYESLGGQSFTPWEPWVIKLQTAETSTG